MSGYFSRLSAIARPGSLRGKTPEGMKASIILPEAFLPLIRRGFFGPLRVIVVFISSMVLLASDFWGLHDQLWSKNEVIKRNGVQQNTHHRLRITIACFNVFFPLIRIVIDDLLAQLPHGRTVQVALRLIG